MVTAKPIDDTEAISEYEAEIRAAIGSGKHVIHTLDKTGDTKVIWDPDNEDEVANARRTFDDLKKKGYAAFSANKQGEKGEQIRKFDPEAGRIIMVKALRGG